MLFLKGIEVKVWTPFPIKKQLTINHLNYITSIGVEILKVDGHITSREIKISSDNSIYINGSVSLGEVDKDGRKFGQDTFLSKYDSKLNREWLKIEGGIGDDFVGRLNIHPSDNIIYQTRTVSGQSTSIYKYNKT